jgi:hypothetical protein
VKLVIHAGFPNTDAWVFQAACADSRRQLKEVGVCYPDLSNFSDGQSHADLARAIQRDDFDAVDRFIGNIALQGIVQGTNVVLLSSDEFSGLWNQPDLLKRFAKHCAECFDSVEYVALSRSLESLIRNLVRQAIVHFAFNFWDDEGYARRMTEYVITTQAKFKELLGGSLRIHSYDQLVASSRFCNGLLRACVPEIAADRNVILEVPFNAADAAKLDAYSLFGSLLRSAIAKSQNTNPYAPAVQSEFERLLPRQVMQEMSAAVDMPHIGNLVAQMIDKVVNGTLDAWKGYKEGDFGSEMAPELASVLSGSGNGR